MNEKTGLHFNRDTSSQTFIQDMVCVDRVCFRYRECWVLRDVSFKIAAGQFIGLIGPNGSGKSTLLKILCRVLVPQKGDVLFEGVSLKRMSRTEIARKIAVVAQETHLLFPFTALEVVLMGRSPHIGRRMFESAMDIEIARTAMAWTETLHVAERLIEELSGGERKRVFIAKALAQQPELMLLDEPTANLDIHHQLDFLNLLARLNRERNITIVMASHELNIASEFCDRLILLHDGTIDRQGAPEEVITLENIERVYGQRIWIDRHPFSGTPRISLLRKERP